MAIIRCTRSRSEAVAQQELAYRTLGEKGDVREAWPFVVHNFTRRSDCLPPCESTAESTAERQAVSEYLSQTTPAESRSTDWSDS
jgi:hypothetical protein